MGFEGWMQLIVQGGSLVVLAMVLYILFDRAIPNLLEKIKEIITHFSKEISAARSECFTALKEIQDININAYKEHREASDIQMQKVADALNKNTDAMNDVKLELVRCKKGAN